MSRVLEFSLVLALSLVGSGVAAQAYDYRLDPNGGRPVEIKFTFARDSPLGTHGGTASIRSRDLRGLPQQYASAMTLYRVALADGYSQPPMVAVPWNHDEQLPEPLHWAWTAENGNMITRVGKGVFRMSFADNQNNWFRESECRLSAWPGGDAEAPMLCSDGSQRKMHIPGDGVVIIDDVQYTRVFNSDETTLPPPEEISVEDLTPAQAAALLAADLPASDLPDHAPIPQLR